MALLEIQSLKAGYGAIEVLHGLTFEVNRGEVVALLGANGAGKSTVLKSIMGIVKATQGEMQFRRRSLNGISITDRALAGLAYSPEGRRVFPGMTVRENLLVASHASNRRAVADQLSEIYRLFPALLKKEHALAWQLSGGQQQMLAVGRALMLNPRLLLLDEPSLGLSPLLTAEVFARLRSIRERGTAILLAEQNVTRALEVADRAYVLQLGQIVDEGTPVSLQASDALRKAFVGA